MGKASEDEADQGVEQSVGKVDKEEIAKAKDDEARREEGEATIDEVNNEAGEMEGQEEEYYRREEDCNIGLEDDIDILSYLTSRNQAMSSIS